MSSVVKNSAKNGEKRALMNKGGGRYPVVKTKNGRKLIANEMKRYFDIEYTKIKKVISFMDGEEIVKEVEIAENLPTFERFAANIGISIHTLNKWREEDNYFNEAYEICKAIQTDMIVNLGLKGMYDGRFATFVAKAVVGLKEAQPVTIINNNIQTGNERAFAQLTTAELQKLAAIDEQDKAIEADYEVV
jgi:DNA-binding transcriptional regulator YiaG